MLRGGLAVAERKSLLLVASAGGHWAELVRLVPAFEGHETLYVTTLGGVPAPSGARAVAIVRDASRSRPDLILLMLAQIVKIVARFRPNLIITTGAAPGLLALQVGRLFGARTVWIDSIANAEELSLSGRMAKYFSDLWLTQWPHLTSKYSGLMYIGTVF